MKRLQRGGRLVAMAFVGVACTVAAVHGAPAPPCSYPATYPGDGAPLQDIAAWMAARAAAAGLPPELPVMAALVESGVQNLPGGDRDSVGFFQMRVAIWNKGMYAGYPQDPDLQIKWFIDSAAATRFFAARIRHPHFGDTTDQWGLWIAASLDTPAGPSRYNRQLPEARRLIDAGRAAAGTWPHDGDYPGDAAPRAAIAAWMASRAIALGMPGELPIMAALVESDMQNLSSGDSDSAGYFNMRKSIWNTAPYAGFPDKPDLQIKWFLDQADLARGQRIVSGDPFFGKDPNQWGEWIADVERPAEQFRGRYQLKLNEARALMIAGCATTR